MELLDIFSTLNAIKFVFRLGRLPQEKDFYELTPEQYEKYYESEGHTSEKIYMFLPEDPAVYRKFVDNGVFVVSESELNIFENAELIIEKYCSESKREFKDLESKLRYMASVLPDVASKGTEYEKYCNLRIEHN
jgi:hypothetical protein